MIKRILAVAAVAAAVGAGSVAGGTWWAHRFGTAHASARAAIVYTCPMHPDYHSDHPGNCPICGMALKEDRGERRRAATQPPARCRPAQCR
jgi:hypothetical protein